MFNLQVTLSDFQCRKKGQYELTDDFVITLRFGSIKLDIKISSTYGQFIGGKRIILDISAEELQQMFITYSLGMFIDTRSLRLFSLLSLENLHYSDVISGQEVYFYNDSQQVVYVACFSIVFSDFKNPRLPNKEVIENHKTFSEMFKKPAVPVAGKTMSSFLYGNNVKENVQMQQKVKPARPASGKVQKSVPTKIQSNNKNVMGKTTTGGLKKHQQFSHTTGIINNNFPKKFVGQTPISEQNIHIYSPFDEQPLQQTDNNPPMMQFTNTIIDKSGKGMGILRTQLQQLNSLQSVRLIKAYQGSKNEFMKHKGMNGEKDVDRARIKIQQQFLMKTVSGGVIDNNVENNYQRKQQLAATSAGIKAVDREQLRTRAKQQLSTYQGSNTIKIPIFKDGKHQLIQLSKLSQQQIKTFAQKQKQLEFQQQMRRQMQRQLQKKQKENLRLKKQLQDKEKQMKKRQQQAKKQRQQLLKRHEQQMRTNQLKQHQIKQSLSQSQFSQNSQQQSQQQNNYNDSQIYSSKQQNNNHKQQQQQNYYESDFQSMISANKLQRASLNSSQKKHQQSSYNEEYDQDFQSYSQSFLDSKLRLSASQISQSNYYSDQKK